MKKTLHIITSYCFAVIIYCSSYHVATAQMVYVPDVSFRNELINQGYGSCIVGDSINANCSLVLNTTYLNLQGKNLWDITGISAFTNLQQLLCDFNILSFIPNLPPTLTELSCEWNNIASLPALPATLVWLSCFHNSLTNLPTLPPNLTYLNCRNNLLTSLPTLPSTLNELRADNNNLASLPVLPNSLEYFSCGYNNIYSFYWLSSSLPPFLKELTMNHNHFSTLLPLPSTLTALNLEWNDFDSLPIVLPPSLYYFNCSYNQVASIPPLPASLQVLYCVNTLIDSLPALPPILIELYCNNNQLTSIPQLPQYLNILKCSNNQITSLPQLNPALDYLICNNNPGLTCLPKLHDMVQLSFFSTSISCIPNYVKVSYICSPPLSSLPLCDLFNNNGCESYWNISGQVYSDTNNNCLKESTEPKLANVKMLLYDSIENLLEQTLTINEGLFSFDTDTGNFTFTVDTTDLPIYVSCPSSGYDSCYIPSNDTMRMDNDFGINCKPGFDVGVNTVVRDSGLIRPANFARIHFYSGDMSNKYGLNCASGVTGTVQVLMNGNATYIVPAANALTPVVSGDTLLYAIADFGNVNFYSDFGIIIQTDTTAQAGDQICFDVSVTPVNGDNVSSNNSLAHCFTVSNSYDPNLKSVYPSKIIDDKNGKLTYTIQFQNTGNAPAQHIYIIDTLDANLDISTFELLAYTVQPVVQLIGNVARFNFPNINLPDSNSNEPGSHGFVQFRIKLKDSLQLHTAIENTSSIYFDFNPPVQTNTVVDTLLDCNMVVSSFNISKASFCKDDTLFANVSLNDDAIINWYLDNVLVTTDSAVSIPSIGLGNHVLKTEVVTYYCTKEIITQIVFNDLPYVDLGNDTSVCNSILLDAGNGFANYLWSTGETTQTVQVNLSSLYSVIVTDTNNCVNFDIVAITVNSLPTLELGNDTTTCNLSVQLDAGAGNASYQWSSGETTQTIIASSTNNYSVVITDSNGCTNADSITVAINLLPAVTFTAFPNADTLCISSGLQTINSGNPTGGYFSGTGVAGNQFDPIITGTGMQYITYQFTDSNGCSNSATDSIWVDLCLGINSISKDETFIVYPNPLTSNSLYIGYSLSNNKAGKFQIINTTGLVVYQSNLPQWSNKQDLILPNLANGIYNATIILDNKRVSKTIAIIRE
jgi:uncharacterized repeat protein (TIGR01451 family)